MASTLDIEPPNGSPNSRQFRLVDSPSPYSHLLGTTIAFSGRPEDLALKAELSAFIGVVDAEIFECRRKVDDLRAALITAEADLAGAQVFRDLHASIFPPVHTLPPEVLSKIFKKVVGREMTPLWVPKCAGPWVLRQVCSYWRRTAESEPHLWRSFGLYKEITDTLTASKRDTAADRLAQTLEWSGSHRLTFVVDLRLLQSGSSTDDRMSCSLNVLLSNPLRWSDARFVGFSQVLPCYPQFDIGDLKTLRHLMLVEEEGSEHSDFDLTALEKFANAPKLHSLTITVLPTFTPRVAARFPWHRLTGLQLNFSISKKLDSKLRRFLISVSPNLLTYHEDGASGGESTTWPVEWMPVIVCHHLETLRVSGIHLLSSLECPRLQCFSLPSVKSTRDSDLVIDFLTRSSPQHLTHLRVGQHESHSLPPLPTGEVLVIEAKSSLIMPLRVLKCLATTSLQVVPFLQRVEMKLDMRSMTVSRSSALEMLEHLATRAQNSKLAQFSLELYNIPSLSSSSPQPSSNAGQKSDLDQFLSILCEASVPELEIKLSTSLKRHKGK